MKTTTEFNTKWADYLEEGHYGLDIQNEIVINYLDREFEYYVKKDLGFLYAQVKLKFGNPRVYTNAPQEQNTAWEKGIKQKMVAMTQEELTRDGWIQTDGSCSTLQYAKEISSNTWLYRQWLDKTIFDLEVSPMQQWKESFSCEHKLDNWDSNNWAEAEICLADYSEEEIAEALSTYGYRINYYYLHADEEVYITIEDDGYIYPVHDSIQLACECIFELQN